MNRNSVILLVYLKSFFVFLFILFLKLSFSLIESHTKIFQKEFHQCHILWLNCYSLNMNNHHVDFYYKLAIMIIIMIISMLIYVWKSWSWMLSWFFVMLSMQRLESENSDLLLYYDWSFVQLVEMKFEKSINRCFFDTFWSYEEQQLFWLSTLRSKIN